MSRSDRTRDNLASLVNDFVENGTQVAVVVERGLRRRPYTYAELATLTGRFAKALTERNIVRGERVLIWGPNGPEWIAALLGCILKGVLPVPLDNAGSTDFASRVVRDVEPKLIVASGEHAAQLCPITPVISFEHFEDALPADVDLSPVQRLNESDPLQIIFTSGTTGDPKGIVHSHGNVLASLRPIEREMKKYLKYEKFFHPLRFLHTLPLSHVFGQFMGLWLPPLIAAEVHFQERLVASELVDRIRTERISVLAAVPRVLDLLRDFMLQRFPDVESRLESLGKARALKRWWAFRDVHRLFGFKFWAMICGGAALPSRLEEFWNALGFAVVQGYGMTETTALVSVNHPFRAAQGSLGQVLAGREIKITEEGEVLVRGETIARSIWQDGRLQESDSEWLATGDLATLDESGNLRFRGRKKDVIVTAAGLNIYPDDLEAVLLRQPEVKACTVIEFVGPYGPEPMAVLILRGGDASAVVGQANRELAEFQQIRRWMIWSEPELPRTSTGKVMKREVAKVTVGTSQAEQSRGSLESLLKRFAKSADDAGPNGAGAEELNLDSLGRVELQASLEEQFGLAINDSEIQQVRNVSDLKKLFSENRQAEEAVPRRAELEKDSHIYPVWPWKPLVKGLRIAFIELVMRPFVFVLANPLVRRTTGFSPGGPHLVYANHVTAVDTALILFALPPKLRHSAAIAMSGEILLAWRNHTYYNYRFLNWISPVEYLVVTALFNAFPLPQKSGFRRSFRHAGRAMDRGYSVIVFPEGKRSTDEKIQPFMNGSGLLWSELGCPALPIYLGGLGELKRTGAHWFRSRKLQVVIGESIPFDAGLSAEDGAKKLERELTLLERSLVKKTQTGNFPPAPDV